MPLINITPSLSIRQICLVIALLILFITTNICYANKTMQLRTIGVAPYGVESNDAYKGIYYEITELMLASSEFKADHYIYPYVRIMHELKSGVTDMTIMFKYDELKEHVDYLVPLAPIQNVVVGLQNLEINSLVGLEGKTLGYLRGAKLSDEIDNNDKIEKYLIPDFKRGVEMLAFGRVDAIIGPYEALVFAAKMTGQKSDFFGVPIVVSERTPWLQISKKSAFRKDAKKITGIFERLVAEGSLAQIRNKYTLN
jgi:polar amino acid transport system substrate-binding protein